MVVPAGKFLTGPIHLLDNVELHLAEGAELIFSDCFEDYLPPVLVRVGGIEIHNYSPLVYAHGRKNIAITGSGRLNGNAKSWWGWKTKETKDSYKAGETGTPVAERVFGTPEAAIRPSFVSFVDCRNILLEDFTIGSGPNWTIHPVYCENLTIRRVTVDTDGPNNDGIDPDSCRDVLIEHCTFNTGDDCVVLKSGYNEDGWRVGKPTENVIMRHCFSKHGHGGLVIGSEMSGDVRNVFMHDCRFEGTDRAIRIKSRRGRGGVVEKVYARDISVKNMKHEVIILNMDYTADKNKAGNDKAPVFRDMTFERITADGAPVAIRIQGEGDSPISDIRFSDISIKSTRGVIASHASGLLFENVSIISESGAAFEFSDVAGAILRRAPAPADSHVFLKLTGRGCRDILIESSELGGAREPVAVSGGANLRSVTIR